jgi:hypothetical protein
MTESRPNCVFCECNSDQVPLLTLNFRGKQTWICPQHLPVLIHDPVQLIGKLPGAENLSPADHLD